MTMTEMVVVMAIVGILVGLGVPSFRYVTNSNRLSSEVDALLGDMQFARSESLREGRTVTVCISSNGTSCAGSTTYTWQSGWVVFSDLNNDGVIGATDPVLRVQRTFSSTDDFQDSAKTVTQVRFNREGFATGMPNTLAVGLYRARDGILGDIIDSSPAWVPPLLGLHGELQGPPLSKQRRRRIQQSRAINSSFPPHRRG
jgi:type IV fimbrial biogenesis protein FimT